MSPSKSTAADRESVFANRRQRVAQSWEQSGSPGVVLLYSGSAVPAPGTDLVHPFFPHPDLVHLVGSGTPRLLLAYSDGAWQLFGYRSTPDEMTWEQPYEALGLPLSELADWLSERLANPVTANPTAANPITLLGAPLDETLSAALLPLSPELLAKLTTNSDSAAGLSAAIAQDRLHKDAAAIADLREAAACSLRGFDWVFENVSAGMTEREVLIGLEAEFFGAGAARVAYDSIVAAGTNSAFLHYVPSATEALRPATATINKGDLLLIDAGAQIGGYASDVTRTMVVGAPPTDEQSFLWHLVLRAQEQAIDRCRPGTEWREVHLDAAKTIAVGLVELGVLAGEPSELVSSGAVALFFPHGLGHLIGLAVHDAGGYGPGREPSSHPQMRYLRTDRVLEPGMVTSVEPGVYFIEALLGDPQMRERFAAEVVWERVDELRGFGGIRIEDDVLVKDGDPEVLSAAIAKPLQIG